MCVFRTMYEHDKLCLYCVKLYNDWLFHFVPNIFTTSGVSVLSVYFYSGH